MVGLSPEQINAIATRDTTGTSVGASTLQAISGAQHKTGMREIYNRQEDNNAREAQIDDLVNVFTQTRLASKDQVDADYKQEQIREMTAKIANMDAIQITTARARLTAEKRLEFDKLVEAAKLKNGDRNENPGERLRREQSALEAGERVVGNDETSQLNASHFNNNAKDSTPYMYVNVKNQGTLFEYFDSLDLERVELPVTPSGLQITLGYIRDKAKKFNISTDEVYNQLMQALGK